MKNILVNLVREDTDAAPSPEAIQCIELCASDLFEMRNELLIQKPGLEHVGFVMWSTMFPSQAGVAALPIVREIFSELRARMPSALRLETALENVLARDARDGELRVVIGFHNGQRIESATSCVVECLPLAKGGAA